MEVCVEEGANEQDSCEAAKKLCKGLHESSILEFASQVNTWVPGRRWQYLVHKASLAVD